MTSDNIKSGVYLAAIAAAAYVIYTSFNAANKASNQIAGAAKTVGGWVNPTSSENLAYRGVNAIGGAIAGQSDWSLGGAIYDWTHTGTSPYVAALVNPGGYPSTAVSAEALAEDKKVNGWSAWDSFGNYTDPIATTGREAFDQVTGEWKGSGGGGKFNGTGATGTW